MELKDFSKTLKNIREITQEELIALAKRARAGDQGARRELIERNMPLVITVAARHFHKAKHLQKDDIVQQAAMGLIEAVDRYDPTKLNPKNQKPYRFSTYAVFWIEHMIQHGLQHKEDEIHVPHQRMKETSFDNPVSHSLDDPQLGEKTDMDFIEAQQVLARGPEISEPLRRLIEATPFTGLEREVVKLRAGLCDEVERSEREISFVLGVAIGEVREILKKARAKLEAAGMR